MRTTTTTPREQGFTLVELAIVLVIVGLLIGGILKGQELIAGTRVNSAVTQIKAIETATFTFLDTYGGFPGDLANAAGRIPGCTTFPCSGGTLNTATAGNSRIDGTPALAYGANAAAATTDEKAMFFNQLRAADLISGFTGAANNTVGDGVMPSSLAGGTHYRIGTAGAVGDLLAANPAAFSAGHYLTLTGTPTGTAIAATVAGVSGLEPKQSEGIDRKLDDSRPNTGRVLAANQSGTLSGTTCVSATGATGIYNTAQTGSICSLYIGVAQ